MPASDLTDSDRRFLEVAITCLKEPPQLDVPRIAEILGIKNKSVTNKWWEIKKKLWGVEVARAAGEKTRQLATAAGVKRKHEAVAANPPPPKLVKEKVRWYTNTDGSDVAPSPTTPTTAAPVHYIRGFLTAAGAAAMDADRASESPDGGSAVPVDGDGDGDGDGVAYATAAADVTSTVNPPTTTTESVAPTTETEIETTEPQVNHHSEPGPPEHNARQEAAPAEDADDVGGHASDGEEDGGHVSDADEAGVV